jgi:hypothetical protein
MRVDTVWRSRRLWLSSCTLSIAWRRFSRTPLPHSASPFTRGSAQGDDRVRLIRSKSCTGQKPNDPRRRNCRVLRTADERIQSGPRRRRTCPAPLRFTNTNCELGQDGGTKEVKKSDISLVVQHFRYDKRHDSQRGTGRKAVTWMVVGQTGV